MEKLRRPIPLRSSSASASRGFDVSAGEHDADLMATPLAPQASPSGREKKEHRKKHKKEKHKRKDKERREEKPQPKRLVDIREEARERERNASRKASSELVARGTHATTPTLRYQVSSSSSSVFSEIPTTDLETLDAAQLINLLQELQILRLDERSFFEDQIESVMNEFTKSVVEKIRVERELDRTRKVLSDNALSAADTSPMESDLTNGWFLWKRATREDPQSPNSPGKLTDAGDFVPMWIVCRPFALLCYEGELEAELVGCILLDVSCSLYKTDDDGAVALVIDSSSLREQWELVQSDICSLEDMEQAIVDNTISKDVAKLSTPYQRSKASLDRIVEYRKLASDFSRSPSLNFERSKAFFGKTESILKAACLENVSHAIKVSRKEKSNYSPKHRASSVSSAPEDHDHLSRKHLEHEIEELRAKVQMLETALDDEREAQHERELSSANALNDLEEQYKAEVSRRLYSRPTPKAVAPSSAKLSEEL